MIETMSICVQNLGKYNEGELVFEWLDLPATEEKIQETLSKIGINEQYEEYMIADSEYIKAGEYESIDSVNERAEDILRLKEEIDISLELIEEIQQDYKTEDVDELIDTINDAIVIETDASLSNEATVGYYYFDLMGIENELPSNFVNYFDYEKYGRDILIESSYYSDDNHIVIMSN